MKLSQLITYLNLLQKHDVMPAIIDVRQHLNPIEHLIKSHELQYGDLTEKITQQFNDIIGGIENFDSLIAAVRSEIIAQVKKVEPRYLEESYRLYDQEFNNDSVDYILSRRPILRPETEEYLRSRILRYSDWHHPGMIIRPGVETWIENLVALDPMYLVDTHNDLMTPVIERFSPEYQNRLRRYIIDESRWSEWMWNHWDGKKESENTGILSSLPKNQFGFVLAYNYFNFKPLEIVRTFLHEVYNVLAPGGTFGFTFNDCDRVGGVELFERCFTCYTPGGLILSAAELSGFEITHRFEVDSAITWVEAKKPGRLTSLRGGQSLAKIVTKNQQ